jgi:aryl-alcohol dehydrogenase-like predicted oxidoreductase
MAGGKLLKSDSSSAPALDSIAGRHGATVAQLSLAWLLHRSPAMVPIPGTSKVSHLEENIAASALQLTDEEFSEMEKGGQT